MLLNNTKSGGEFRIEASTRYMIFTSSGLWTKRISSDRCIFGVLVIACRLDSTALSSSAHAGDCDRASYSRSIPRTRAFMTGLALSPKIQGIDSGLCGVLFEGLSDP